MSTRMQYQPPVSGMGGQRLPPLPPPKPRMFEARMPQDYEGRLKGDPSAPPGDSDTDSGICADSEQSSSPSSQQPQPAVSYHPQQLYRNRPQQQQQQQSSATAAHPQHHYYTTTGSSTVSAGAPYTTRSFPQQRRYGYAEDDHRDYLTPNSARRLFDGVVPSASPRRLPARPTSAASGAAPGGAPRAPSGRAEPPAGGTLGRAATASAATNGGTNGKQYRVRFADQIAAPANGPSSLGGLQQQQQQYPQQHQQLTNVNPQPPSSFSSSLTSSPSTSTASPTMMRNGGYAPSMKESSPQHQMINYDTVNDRRADAPRGYSVDDVESLPEPPSYSLALQRMRSDGGAVVEERGRSRSRREQETSWSAAVQPRRESVRDTIIRQSLEDTLRQREFEREQREPLYLRNRSASLPRGHRRSEGEIQPLWRHQISPSQLASSVDNLHLEMDNLYVGMEGAVNYADSVGSLQRRRCLPPLPSAGDISVAQGGGYGRRPAYSRGRRCRGVTDVIARRSASVGRYPSTERVEPVQYPPPVQMAPLAPSPHHMVDVPVRAQLIALGHRGFRTVLIEKVQPGPFGFYIATGVVNGQRGIFISRVSIASLSPILSIGDEILYVDDELVKGRSLEYVQSLIAGKTSVTIVLLPTVGPAC
ncbi:hypothetical protein PRIPAC_72540 [Pristionchus pacificus]|uniref:PDZ domain-containing protein n=1 Tax=Pristionchus pacificus TaxID=54126 RepID=A0A2A6C5R4_PRIPA|nr:hypothetical protein PRIPAC_72540 [Pristionchus pacificus]|eukprot:PDM73393.1 PDZ domain-containing protein [Pristionchus pacificus]